MEGIVFLVGIIVGVGILMWKDILSKEKVGGVMVPPSAKNKLIRLFGWLFIPVVLFFAGDANKYTRVWGMLLGLITCILLRYFSTEEDIKMAKKFLTECDPQVIKEYEEKKDLHFKEQRLD